MRYLSMISYSWRCLKINRDIFEKIHRIDYLITETNALYHEAALKLGVSDSVMRVLYTIYDNGKSCLLSDVYKRSGIRKQTVNSAIRKLEEDGVIYLEQYKGKSKMICITDSGKELLRQTAGRLYEVERLALACCTDEEVAAHIRLLEKYAESLRTQVQRLDQIPAPEE